MRRYTDEQFIEVVQSALNWAGVLRSLNLRPGGGTQRFLQELAKSLQLDTSHMGKHRISGKRSIEKYLVYGSIIGTNNLKHRLWEENILEMKCSECGSEEWFGRTNHLQMDHINGDSKDNRLDNLRILCANCHSGTDTYGGKNQDRAKNKSRSSNGQETTFSM